MTIIDRANAFIGHEQEVDEGYETTMRRNAFVAGFKEALELVRKMREAQQDHDIVDMRLRYHQSQDREIPDDVWNSFACTMDWMVSCEDEVDELLKEMEDEE